jgi:predicted aconitase
MALVAQIAELCKLGHPLFQDQLELISFKADQREPSELADLCASLTTSSGFALQVIFSPQH